MRTIALCLALTALPGPMPQAATGCATDAMLVFDGSGSMAEVGHDPTAATRINDARAALRRVMPEIAPYRRIGLLTYGAGGTHPCSGITRHFDPMPDAGAAVVAYHTQPGIVVLVTDGNETCGGTPCALGKALAAEARDLTVHVIGFRVVHDPFSWNSPEAQGYDGQTVAKCLADATGGLFVSTETVDELATALRETLGCPLIGGLRADAPPLGRG
jgi:Ca-activated chloride channel family protein